MTDDEAMRLALAWAARGLDAGELPIGAVVVVGDEVVGAAHTEERKQDRLLVHADLLALDRADASLRGRRAQATLAVNLEPCLMCFGAAFTMRIGRVVFALASPTDGGWSVAQRWDRERDAAGMPGYRLPEVRAGVLRAESAALFRRYADAAPDGWARAWADDLARQVRDTGRRSEPAG